MTEQRIRQHETYEGSLDTNLRVYCDETHVTFTVVSPAGRHYMVMVDPDIALRIAAQIVAQHAGRAGVHRGNITGRHWETAV